MLHTSSRRRAALVRGCLVGSAALVIAGQLQAAITLSGSVSPSPAGASPWIVPGGTLTIGDTASGTMTISGGSAVASNFSIIGSGGLGRVTVTGSGSTWIN